MNPKVVLSIFTFLVLFLEKGNKLENCKSIVAVPSVDLDIWQPGVLCCASQFKSSNSFMYPFIAELAKFDPKATVGFACVAFSPPPDGPDICDDFPLECESVNSDDTVGVHCVPYPPQECRHN